ncbi:MAG: hypothetical protein HND56_05555 [Pseudomonadota bacterium]|nr:hypothetical protein [Pseudomonadota bacterium]QKK05186.1 MAG: hypothetical protein HND56_05555 [Pseudomonadota bacterium]
MATIGPVQTPVTNTFQPGIGNNNDRAGTVEQEARTNQVQPRGAESAESQRSESRTSLRERTQENNDRAEAQAAERRAAASEAADEQGRGRIVDVEV